ncbi:MAG: hypothetical protein WA947_15335 [Phormidesmis sp.]
MVERAQSNDTPAGSAAEESPEASSQEVAEVVAELEKYRARLVEDFTTAAKKAKLPKSMTNAQLKAHPEIAKIDASLAKLRGESTSPTS